jgi:hypothetical protein
MSSFDYNAPAELFLAKPIKGSRTKYRRFATAAEAIRYAVEDFARPEPSELGWRLGMSVSTATTFSGFMPRVIFRCASLWATERARAIGWGLLRRQFQEKDPHPLISKRS